MFQLASGFYQNYLSETELSLLIIGLDGAGKTTLLERVKVTDFKTPPKIATGKRIVLEPLGGGGGGCGSGGGASSNSSRHDVTAINESEEEETHQPVTPEKDEPANATVEEAEEAPPTPPQIETTISSSPERRRRLFSCPAPRSYRNAMQDDDDDELIVPTTSMERSNSGIVPLRKDRPASPIVPPPKAPTPKVQTTTVVDEEHQEEDSRNGSSTTRSGTTTSSNTTSTSRLASSPLSSCRKSKQQPVEYDTKPNTKMFPLSAIRPTIGQNLKKIKALSTNLTIFDVGGSVTMRPIWERYYKDVQGIVYVVDISSTCAVSKLMESRAMYNCMRDEEGTEGVPILIFGNDKGLDECDSSNGDINSTAPHRIPQEEEADVASAVVGDTSLLDITALFLSPPRGLSGVQQHHHHSSMQCGLQENVAFFAGSAKTGEGVRAAFEWLIRRSAHLQNKGGRKLSRPPV